MMLELSESLQRLLHDDQNAREYYRSLHPSVRAQIAQEEISTPEQLTGRANDATSALLVEYIGLYDDGTLWAYDPIDPTVF